MKSAKIGETFLYSGIMYTARDAAHARLEKMLKEGQKIPIDFTDSLIYYAGPTPAKPGHAVGSIGPTTSSRMDPYSYMMKKLGVVGTIGKGPRSQETKDLYNRDGILYYVTAGGIGALLSQCVLSCEVVAFEDLGTEAIRKLVVSDFPLTLAFDYDGNDILWKDEKDES